MFDMWVQNIKTGEAWRLDQDDTKEVYKDADGQTIYKCDIGAVRFFPCCPKSAPVNETIETGEQLSIFDYMKGGANE